MLKIQAKIPAKIRIWRGPGLKPQYQRRDPGRFLVYIYAYKQPLTILHYLFTLILQWHVRFSAKHIAKLGPA